MDNYLSFNLPNILTVCLMAAVGFTLWGCFQAGLKSATGG